MIDPKHLSVCVLADEVREKLASRYDELGPTFAHVAHALRQPREGEEARQRFVRYTRNMDRIRGTRVSDCVPELAPMFA